MEQLLDVIYCILGIGIYLLPGIIASSRKLEDEQAIWLWNIFGGWVGIIWIVCIIRSFTGKKLEKTEQEK